MNQSRNTELASGAPVTPGYQELDPKTGMQKDYLVLTKEEREKGFVRPLRDSYVHVGIGAQWDGPILLRRGTGGCGTLTRMSKAIAETYARDPKFYSGTFCVGCGMHRPLAEFVWDGTQEIVGS